MTWLIVTRPGEERRLREVSEVSDLGARLYAEVTSIEALGNERACRICGRESALTEEHAPSKSAGNRGRFLRGTIDDEQSKASGRVTWTAAQVTAATYPTLCAQCNNNSGTWYNPAYVRLANHCRTLARPKNAGQLVDVELALHPQRVAKQALASILAVAQRGVSERYPHLQELIVNKQKAGPTAPLRLGLYLRANRGGRSSGLATAIDVGRRVGRIFAEFSFWPLGWLVSFDGSELQGVTEVSGWTEMAYHEKVPLKITISCQWAISPYPGDFRPPSAFSAPAEQQDEPPASPTAG